MLPAYSPKDVKVAFQAEGLGSVAVTGFSPTSFIRFKRNAPVIKEVVGLSGEVAISTIKDNTGTVELELMQTATMNFTFSDLYRVFLQNQVVGKDIDLYQLTITDKSGSTLVEARNLYFKDVPDISLGSSQNSKTWVFGCGDLFYNGKPTNYSDGLFGIITPTLPF